MPFSLRFALMLMALTVPTLRPGLSTTLPPSASTAQQSNSSSTAEATLLDAEQLYQTGIEHFNRSEFQAALELWEEALALFRLDEVDNLKRH